MKKSLLPLASLFLLSACAETQFGAHVAKNWEDKSVGAYKVGKPYLIDGQEYYPQETFSYVETGIASWYGPGFHGENTANGEKFDTNELTAAHRTLQMPSLVRVTNLENGRSVVVRVNDRGPFAKSRIIDLSSKAADLLNMKGKGTAKVRVEMLSAESQRIAQDAKSGKDTSGYEVALNNNRVLPGADNNALYYPNDTAFSVTTETPADSMNAVKVASVESVSLEPSQTAPVAGHIASDGRFMPNPVVTNVPVPATSNIFIQAGAFSDAANAQRLSSQLGAYGTAKVYPTTVSGKSFYRVRLGPYSSVDQADAALAQVSVNQAPNARIVVE